MRPVYGTGQGTVTTCSLVITRANQGWPGPGENCLKSVFSVSSQFSVPSPSVETGREGPGDSIKLKLIKCFSEPFGA